MPMSDVYGDADTLVPERDQQRAVAERSQFLVRVYGHLIGAIFAFVGVAAFLMHSGMGDGLVRWVFSGSWNWMLLLGGFMVVSWLASGIAAKAVSLPAQYAALGIYVIAQAVIMLPLLYYAEAAVGADIIGSAAFVTLLGFSGLSAIVWVTRKDFGFLRPLIIFGFVLAGVAIVASLIFGMHLGTWFSVAMIALAGGAILYQTSDIMHRYPGDRYVAGALALFASVALLFWYVLQLLISLNQD